MKSAQKLILVFVLNSLIWFGVTSNKMFAQEIDSDHKTTDTNKVETKDLNGKLLLNGKAVEFSTLDELQAITERLVKESNNGTAKTKKIIPNYLEMNSDDLAKTKTFYRKAFGFEFIDYGSQYAAISSGPIAIGFAVRKKPSAPMPAFQTFEIESTLKSVKAANGKIEKPIFEFPGGRRFEFTDLSGNRVAVFQNN